MTNERKQYILKQISELLSSLDEPTKTDSSAVPKKVEMLTINECSLSPEKRYHQSEQGRAKTEKYLFQRQRYLLIL